MAESKIMRLSQVARKLNVGSHTIVDFLASKGFKIESSPNAKILPNQLAIVNKEYADSALDKKEASGINIGQKIEDIIISKNSVEEVSIIEKDVVKGKTISSKTKSEVEKFKTESPKLQGIKVVGKIDLIQKGKKKEKKNVEQVATVTEVKEVVKTPAKSKAKPKKTKQVALIETNPEKISNKSIKEKSVVEREIIKDKSDALKGLTVVGKVAILEKPKKIDEQTKPGNRNKRPRKRISTSRKTGLTPQVNKKLVPRGKRRIIKQELTDKEIQDKIKATIAKLSVSKSSINSANRLKYRKEKRSAVANAQEVKLKLEKAKLKNLKVTEYISASDLASLMHVSVNSVISTCMSLGVFASINQRLDAEAITLIADEFGFNVEFTICDNEVEIIEEVDEEKDLIERAPIVTIMGHVDHGKTSLLDFIRKSSVTEGEAGGITQHIGAYDVMTDSGKRIIFLDTPGHEAFTAMRARGTKVTDIVIIVIAADDNVMPQTKEAINHAQVAGAPIVIAINKIDKENANPEKIKESLSQNNILVEEWGGKYQCQEISTKTGEGIENLLEKLLLESELLELKANPNKKAVGSVLEATLDKGRGYLTTILVQSGTIKIGNILLVGSYFGKVKAMFNHHGNKLDQAGPSIPVQMLGLSGAPQAGDKFNVMNSDKEAKEIAIKRDQILREQNVRTKKHITLDEIGRRLAIGSFKELNVIVKGDVDGSIEALSDSLLKLSTDEVQVNIIHKAVGQISESDVHLANASDAVIIGFQVRPSGSAKKNAEKNGIEIRLYSVIYDAIDDVKDAMEGLLIPTEEEIITGNIEVREVFKISKIGIVAGCYVIDGFVKRLNNIRLIRDGIVTYEGEIGQLKRFKEEVQEVKKSYECGLSIRKFNDIKKGDVIEGYEIKEIKRKL